MIRKAISMILCALFATLVYDFGRHQGWSGFQLTGVLLILTGVGCLFGLSKRKSDQAVRNWKASEVSRLLNPDGENRPLSPEDEAIEKELLEQMSDDPAPIPYLTTDRSLSPDHGFDPTLPLVLYLRPFAFDGRVMVANPDACAPLLWILPFYRAMVAEKVNLEEWMALEFGKHLNFVAIGRPGEVLGAGKVETSDAEWREEFMRLATRADRIISVPAMYTSTLWELEWLASQRMFEKVLMVFTDLHLKDPKPPFQLDELAGKLASHGWHLPEDITCSSLVTFDSEGKCQRHIPRTRFRKRFFAVLMPEGRQASSGRTLEAVKRL